MAGIYDFEVADIRDNAQSMAVYQGKVLLIVNTASKCGFTPQFEGLQTLYSDLADRGLEVLGFPCNQFMKGSGQQRQHRTVLFTELWSQFSDVCES
jgi:glutathione peroxidase